MTKKRAVFAQNASHWRKAQDGDAIGAIRQQYNDQQNNPTTAWNHDTNYQDASVIPVQQDIMNLHNGALGRLGQMAISTPNGISPIDGWKGYKTGAYKYKPVVREYQHNNRPTETVYDGTNYEQGIAKDAARTTGPQNWTTNNAGIDINGTQHNYNKYYQETAPVQPVASGIPSNYNGTRNGVNYINGQVDIPQAASGMMMPAGNGINIQGKFQPLSNQTIELKDSSHKLGGQLVSANGTTIEAEGPSNDGTNDGETIHVDDQGNTIIGGNMEYMDSGIKFKKLFKEIGKTEGKIVKEQQKNQKSKDKTLVIANNITDPTNRYGAPTAGTVGVMADAHAQRDMEITQVSDKVAQAKQYLTDMQNAQLQANGKTAKNGARIPKAQAGANLFDPKYAQLVNRSKQYLQQIYPNKDIDIYQSSGDRDIQGQAGKVKQGSSQTPVSLHNAGAARDFHIYVNGKVIDNKNSDVYKKSLWKAADELGLYHLNGNPPSAEDPKPFGNIDPYHISVVKESNDHTAYKRLLQQYPQILETPILKKTEEFIKNSQDPIAQSIYGQIQEVRNNKKAKGGYIAQKGKKIVNTDVEADLQDPGYVYHPSKKVASDVIPYRGNPQSTGSIQDWYESTPRIPTVYNPLAFDNYQVPPTAPVTGTPVTTQPQGTGTVADWFDSNPHTPTRGNKIVQKSPRAKTTIAPVPTSNQRFLQQNNPNPWQTIDPMIPGTGAPAGLVDLPTTDTNNYAPQEVDMTGMQLPAVKPYDQLENDGTSKKPLVKGMRNKFHIGDYLGEIMAGFDKAEPVQSVQAQAILEPDYNLSLQQKKNSIISAYKAGLQNADNPAQQAAIAGQMAEQLGAVDSEEFSMNQQNRGQIMARNAQELRGVRDMNLKLGEDQYAKQAQAKAIVDQNHFNAAQSISSKEAQRRYQNNSLALGEQYAGWAKDDNGNWQQIRPDYIYGDVYNHAPDLDAEGNKRNKTISYTYNDRGQKTGEVVNGAYKSYQMGGMMSGPMPGMGGAPLAKRTKAKGGKKLKPNSYC